MERFVRLLALASLLAWDGGVVSSVAAQQRPCSAYKTQQDCSSLLSQPRSSQPRSSQPRSSQPRSSQPLPRCGSGGGSNTSYFALIGDYGLASGQCEAHVQALLQRIVKEVVLGAGEYESHHGVPGGRNASSSSSYLDALAFVATQGDNAYWSGACSSYSSSVAPQFGSLFPAPRSGCTDPFADPKPELSGPSSSRASAGGAAAASAERTTSGSGGIRFFPSIGNHDWDTYHASGAQLPYLQFFDYLAKFAPDEPSRGQYYSVDPAEVAGGGSKLPRGAVRLFILNSNLGQNGPTPASEAQKKWAEGALKNSTAKFNLVFFHHSPYTTAQHDPPATWMRWPFVEWGASAVVTGHEHAYERIAMNKTEGGSKKTVVPFVVNGLGGHPWIYEIHGSDCAPVAGSMARYNAAHGVILGAVPSDASGIDFCFYSTEGGGKMVDRFSI